MTSTGGTTRAGDNRLSGVPRLAAFVTVSPRNPREPVALHALRLRVVTTGIDGRAIECAEIQRPTRPFGPGDDVVERPDLADAELVQRRGEVGTLGNLDRSGRAHPEQPPQFTAADQS